MDLLVSNGESNTVTTLLGRGNGFFINSPVNPFSTGDDPSQLFVGNFDGTPGLDLITVNTDSNDVTMIANFLTNPVPSTVPSGGTLPVSALVAELNGTSVLLVANSGNGVLELLSGGPTGLEVAATLTQASSPHLSDLALVTAGNRTGSVRHRLGTRDRGAAGDVRSGPDAAG